MSTLPEICSGLVFNACAAPEKVSLRKFLAFWPKPVGPIAPTLAAFLDFALAAGAYLAFASARDSSFSSPLALSPE